MDRGTLAAVAIMGEDSYNMECRSVEDAMVCCVEREGKGTMDVKYVVGFKGTLRVLKGVEYNALGDVGKTVHGGVVTIGVRGEDVMKVVERIPKDFVESAQYIREYLGDLIVLEEDPVVYWVVRPDEGVVSYRVSRGRVPLTLPEIEFAACDFRIANVKVETSSTVEGRVAVVYFEVHDGDRPVFPRKVDVVINGRVVTPERRENGFVASAFIGESDVVKIRIKPAVGGCEVEFSKTFNISESVLPMIALLGVLLVLVAVFLWYRNA